MTLDLLHRPAAWLDLAGDIRRWLAAGPRGHGRLLLAWDDQRKAIDSRDRVLAAAREDRANALLRLDDLAVRILEATLEVGAIGRVEVPIAGESVAGPVYAPEQVERLLETARTALLKAEDVARYATATRRDVRQRLPLGTATLEAHDHAGTLRRVRTLIETGTDVRETLSHALDLITDALGDETP